MIPIGRIAQLLIFALPAFAFTQAAPSPQAPPDPTLKSRPPAPPARLAVSEGRMHLDISVTDAAGNPVTDLEPWDFKLTDNGAPAKLLSFRGYDGKSVLPDPPVEVILLIDELNLSQQQVAFMRDQVIAFLRQNGGHPALPTSIMLLTDKGLSIQPEPSLDGNGMAAMVQAIQPHISSINGATGAQGLMERGQVSLREIERIADNERRRPARKLLFWMGPGWPLLDSVNFAFTDGQRRAFFSAIVVLQNQLRESRITVYSVIPEFSSMGVDESLLFRYRSFLKPVESARQAQPGNLGLGVLAEQSGGSVLGPGNNLAALMNGAIAHANAFYSISLNPPPAERQDEHHTLHIQLDRPGLTLRTNTGYYDEPPPAP
jgi:VWFA-related protein